VHLRNSASVAVLALLSVVVGCGGGKSDAEKSADAALQAKAACDVFVNFHPPAGTDNQSRIDATKATYGAFLKSADLAGRAADLDPRWKTLQGAADHEAAGFEVLAKATEGTSQVDRTAIAQAVSTTKDARPVFLAECAKADPKRFATPTPSPSSTATKHQKKS
jgi:hypothetical protein